MSALTTEQVKIMLVGSIPKFYRPGHRERDTEFESWLTEHDRAISEKAWDQGWDNRDEGTRETDVESEYHYSRLNNPWAAPSRWDAVIERG